MSAVFQQIAVFTRISPMTEGHLHSSRPPFLLHFSVSSPGLHNGIIAMTDAASPPETLNLLSCESSLAAGEHLFGTASRVDTWLLLEYNAPWGAKALPESPLPE